MWDSNRAWIYSFHSWCHRGGRPMCCADFQACENIFEFCWSAMCAKTLISCAFKYVMRSLDSRCLPPKPIHESSPILPREPSLIRHTRLSLIWGSEWSNAFHTDELPIDDHVGWRTQSNNFCGQIYLWYEMWVHRFWLVNKVQPILAAKAWANRGRSFSPHPPHFFGNAIFFQLIQAKILLSWFPFQRYQLHSCCKRDRIFLGIHASAIQKTGVASRTDLIRTSLPTLDKYLWL